MSRVSITAVAAIACVALAVPAAASAKDEAATAAAIGDSEPLQVNLPAESEWTFCATEGARCEFTGTQQVRYGANGQFTLPRTFTDGVACENAVFGDPVSGVVKQCQVTAGTASDGTPVTASQTAQTEPMKDEAATAVAIGTEPIGRELDACDLEALYRERAESLEQQIDEFNEAHRGELTSQEDMDYLQSLSMRHSQAVERASDAHQACLAAQ